MEDGGGEGGNWDGLSPEVLDMIFQHLPVQDLLSCSIVSKNWKKAARDVLKRSRECYAYIKYIPQDLQDLNEMIVSTDIIEMINGLHIRNEVRPNDNIRMDMSLWQRSKRASSFWRRYTSCSDVARILQSGEAREKLDEAKQKILGVLCSPWRYLDLHMGLDVSIDKGLLLREVILSTSGSLQKLVIGNREDWKFIPCCDKSFEKLEVIQAQKEQDLRACWGSSLSKFAPNLKQITGALMLLNVLNSDDRFTLERLKSVSVYSEGLVRQGAEDVFGAVANLHRLDLRSDHRHTFNGHLEQNLAEWNALAYPFMLRSLNTLKELRVRTQDLYNLSTASNGLKFPNLRRLSLAKYPNVSRVNEISFLKNLNLPKLCPNLEQLKLMEGGCFEQVEQEVVPADILVGLEQSDGPMAIDLKYRYGQYDHEHMTLLSSIYPKISKLRILNDMYGSKCDASKMFLSSLWDIQSLEYLEIRVYGPPCDIQFHIEAFLSGIDIQEAQMPCLSSQRKEDLLNLCIVPIRPSLLNAKNLKELKIIVGCNSNCIRHVDRSKKMGLSWVTQLIENLPERHVRNLKVTFDGDHILFCDGLVQMRSLTWLRANMI